jgi:hypothetical protein
MLYPLLAGVLALLLLCLSVWEFRKPSAVAKLTGFAWSAFALGTGSAALMLYITTGATWHLRGNATMMEIDTALLGLTALGMGAGIALLWAVVAKSKSEQGVVTGREARPQDGVWPPPESP